MKSRKFRIRSEAKVSRHGSGAGRALEEVEEPAEPEELERGEGADVSEESKEPEEWEESEETKEPEESEESKEPDGEGCCCDGCTKERPVSEAAGAVRPKRGAVPAYFGTAVLNGVGFQSVSLQTVITAAFAAAVRDK